MNSDLKIYLLTIGLPALFLALGGMRLLRSEGLRLRENDRADLSAQAAEVAGRLQTDIAALVTASAFGAGYDPAAKNPLATAVAASPLLRGASYAGSPDGAPRGDAAGGDHPPPRRRDGRLAGHDPARADAIVVEAMDPAGRACRLEVESLALLIRMPSLFAACGADGASAASPRATVAEVRARDGALLMPASIQPTGSIFGEATLAPLAPGWNIRLYRRGGDTAVAADGVRLALVGAALVLLLVSTLVAGGALLVRSARAAAQEAQRQTDFVSNMSHELKTPLTTICMCAEIASLDSLPEARRKAAFASIAKEANRLREMVDAVLQFGRLERGAGQFSVKELDVSAATQDVCDSMRERFAPGNLAVDAPGPILARADGEALSRIVAALLDNAAKYAGGAPVEISVGKADDGRSVLICVADRGPGVKAELLPRLFDRFWRADNSVTRESGGSGLGLAIARSLARGMGGDLVARLRKGGGLVFELSLPA